ncbi:kelch domain-containing protein 1 [Patella vulgata]|uniref:kelch domain-containing protein 1 n=1 Tax=Patella vulgata TaxID=6465 RepID=UPI00217F3994|nr:kelch domain-containing protein 1 [Patella vulgata]XP_050400203.1 kelch domain-containing protein 1 [Patella vulgata]
MGNETSQNVTYSDKINNDVKLTWKKVGSPFPSVGREGQTACSLGSKVYVFGGVLPGGDEVIESNELFLFDSETLVWEKVRTRGTQPPGRSAASLVGVGDKLYLFGGLSQNFGWFDDLFVFDTVSNSWSVVTGDGERPCARDKLQATVVDKSIYYFGGFGPKSADEDILEEDNEEEDGAEFGWFDDLFVFNTESKKWSEPMQMNLGVPTARAAHGMCTVGRNIVIFGGRDMESRRNDLRMFNIDSRKWNTELKVNGREPEPRSFHTTTSVGNRVVVMGGRGIENQHFADVHIFDTDSTEWLQPNIDGDLPCGRGQHSVVLAGDRVVLFGGSGSFNPEIMQCTEHFTDTYILDRNDILKGSSISSNGTTS